MYKWKIQITLKSGVEKTLLLKCDENESGKVTKKYFEGTDNTFIGMSDLSEKRNVFIKIGEIAYYEIFC